MVARPRKTAAAKAPAKTASKSAPAKASTTGTTESDLSFQNFMLELSDLARKYANAVDAASNTSDDADETDEPEEADEAQTKTPARRTRKAPAKKADAEEDEGYEDDTDDEFTEMTTAQLRKALLERGTFEDSDVKKADRETLLLGLREVMDEEEGEGEEPASEEDIDNRRAELEEKTVAALKKIARDEHGATGPELKDLDKEGVIDTILDAEFPDDTEGDEDDDTDEVADDEADDGYTEDELAEMTVDALNEVIEEWEIDPPKKLRNAKAYKASLVDAIMEAQG